MGEVGAQLQQQSFPRLYERCTPHGFNLMLIGISQAIKSNRVSLMVNDFEKFRFQYYQLCGIHQHLEYGILHPNPTSLT